MRTTSIGHKKFKNGFVDLTLIHAFVKVNSLNEILKSLNKTLSFAVGLRMIRGVLMCKIPQLVMNSLNSSDVNWGPLSETNLSEKPCLENRLSNAFMVSLFEVEDDILITSGHLLYASTTIRYI